ncbi:unannotated protein [freshwater metagenome]|uniref:Unannotated protein n=1 Tax=freshwater metagenome TaxID=449393 RepID=A0A6J7KA54_9ZZZZ
MGTVARPAPANKPLPAIMLKEPATASSVGETSLSEETAASADGAQLPTAPLPAASITARYLREVAEPPTGVTDVNAPPR